MKLDCGYWLLALLLIPVALFLAARQELREWLMMRGVGR